MKLKLMNNQNKKWTEKQLKTILIDRAVVNLTICVVVTQQLTTKGKLGLVVQIYVCRKRDALLSIVIYCYEDAKRLINSLPCKHPKIAHPIFIYLGMISVCVWIN